MTRYLKVATFDRHRRSASRLRIRQRSLLIIGASDLDKTLCANTLLEAGKGIAIIHGGEIMKRLDFPFGRIFSLRPWQEVGESLRQIQQQLKKWARLLTSPSFR